MSPPYTENSLFNSISGSGAVIAQDPQVERIPDLGDDS